MGSNLCVSFLFGSLPFTCTHLTHYCSKVKKLNDQRLDKVEELINIQLYTFCFWL